LAQRIPKPRNGVLGHREVGVEHVDRRRPGDADLQVSLGVGQPAATSGRALAETAFVRISRQTDSAEQTLALLFRSTTASIVPTRNEWRIHRALWLSILLLGSFLEFRGDLFLFIFIFIFIERLVIGFCDRQ